SAWAVSATVPMRRKPKIQKIRSNTSADMATAPMRCASPRRPMTAVPTMPRSGVVRLATIVGAAMANTRVCVTAGGSGDRRSSISGSDRAALRSASGGRPRQPGDQPNRDHHDGAEQEVAPHRPHGIETHFPDADDEALEAGKNVH